MVLGSGFWVVLGSGFWPLGVVGALRNRCLAAAGAGGRGLVRPSLSGLCFPTAKNFLQLPPLSALQRSLSKTRPPTLGSPRPQTSRQPSRVSCPLGKPSAEMGPAKPAHSAPQPCRTGQTVERSSAGLRVAKSRLLESQPVSRLPIVGLEAETPGSATGGWDGGLILHHSHHTPMATPGPSYGKTKPSTHHSANRSHARSVRYDTARELSWPRRWLSQLVPLLLASPCMAEPCGLPVTPNGAHQPGAGWRPNGCKGARLCPLPLPRGRGPWVG